MCRWHMQNIRGEFAAVEKLCESFTEISDLPWQISVRKKYRWLPSHLGTLQALEKPKKYTVQNFSGTHVFQNGDAWIHDLKVKFI